MKKYDKKKFTGCLLGLACGDYLGLPFEYVNVEKTREFFTKNKRLSPTKKMRTRRGTLPIGYYSDDTSQMICLAESLIDTGFDTKNQLHFYKKWLLEGYATPRPDDKAIGVGQHTFAVLTDKKRVIPSQIKNNEKEGGNGALMRCAPIGLLYCDDSTALQEKSILSAIVTHNNEIAAFSCVILNFFISYAIKNYAKTSFCDRALHDITGLPNDLKELLNTHFAKINPENIQTTGYSLYTLEIALYSFFTTHSFEDCLTTSIQIGGDTDTQAAVAGALAGAFYGENCIPLDWINALMRHEHITRLAESMYCKHNS